MRELKKQLTRESISDAALQLTLAKGLDHVTIEEIAQVAFVSPRTVCNYFSCKEEAVVAAGGQDPSAIVEELTQRPTSEPPLRSLCRLLVNFARSRTPEQLRISVQKLELGQQHPSLRPYETAQYDGLEEALREAIAHRTGADIDEDMSPWLMAAAAVSAVKSATALWARSGAPAEQLPDLIQSAFDQISDGLSVRESAEEVKVDASAASVAR